MTTSQDGLQLLRFATAGSVDDGKSTLIGRLLFDSKSLFDDQVEALEDDFDLARLTDGLRAERAQGITIDVAYRYFATPRRRFIIADSPGHVQYTRNMVTAASNAELLVLLVDVGQGTTEQTRRHAYLAGQLGISKVVVAVNKMDQVDFSEASFRSIETELAAIQTAAGIPNLFVIPTSALLGDNVVGKSDNMPWYRGPALLEYLEGVALDEAKTSDPARLFVQGTLRFFGEDGRPVRRYLGQVGSGQLSVGDEVTVLPSGETTRISSIHTFDGEIQTAFSPVSVAVEVMDDVDVGRGDLLANTRDAPQAVLAVSATTFWMAPRELRAGRRLELRHGTRATSCKVTEILHRVNLTALAPEQSEDLAANDVGSIRIALAEALPVDRFADVAVGGRLILVDPHTQETVGAAVVEAVG